MKYVTITLALALLAMCFVSRNQDATITKQARTIRAMTTNRACMVDIPAAQEQIRRIRAGQRPQPLRIEEQ